ncbi:MAG: RsiV family protein [Muribaculaceae bacterium]|nr:RsiV family protein [Muribaculaceae bacterium]
MKNNILPIVLTASVATFAFIASSCGSKSENRIVEYDGEQFFKPTMHNIVADTVFDYDGTKIETTRISRYDSIDDSNNFVSLNIYADITNGKINGAIAKYIEEAVNAFSTDTIVSHEISVDTVLSIDAARMVNVADSTISYFTTHIIPQALSDSVVAVNLAIDVKPVWANSDYVTYSMSSQAYYGGAHGDDDFYLQTFDAKSGSPMGFYNLVPASQQDAVRHKLLDIISRSHDMNIEKYLESVNEWAANEGADVWTEKTFPIAHVALTNQGYIFSYPKYTIAPGSAGCPVYVVPVKN